MSTSSKNRNDRIFFRLVAHKGTAGTPCNELHYACQVKRIVGARIKDSYPLGIFARTKLLILPRAAISQALKSSHQIHKDSGACERRSRGPVPPNALSMAIVSVRTSGPHIEKAGDRASRTESQRTIFLLRLDV